MTDRLNAKVVIGADTAGARREIEKLKNGFGELRTLLLGALGVEGGRRLAELVDGYAAMSARLKLATRDQAEFNTAQKELFAIAQRNQAGVSELTTLYTRLAPAVRQLGGNQSQTLKITEAVALALRVSGASAAESASAILQFSQALGAGALRGEEFNAVAEASPRLMQALADGLGKSRGELRKLAEDGKLTADVVGNALIGQLGALRREADGLPQTIGGAVTKLRNAFQQFIGQSEQVSLGAQALIKLINAIADNLGTLSTAAVAAGVALATLKFAQIAVAIGTFVTSASGLAASFGAVVATLSGPVGLVALVVALTAALIGLNRATDDIKGKSLEALGADLARLTKLQAERAERNRGLINEGDKALGRRIAALQEEIRLRKEAAEAEAELRREANRAEQLAAAGTPLKGGGKVEVNKEFEKELKRLQEELDKNQELTQLEQTRLDILRRRFGLLTPKQQEQLLAAAREVDAEKAFQEAVKASEDATKRANAEQQQLNKARRDWIAQVTGRAGANKLVQDLATLDEEFFAGRISVKEYENGLRRVAGVTDEVKQKTEQTRDAAKELGFTFGSALEEALVDLKPLRDVFAGLGRDLNRVFTREFISGPFAAEATAFFKELFGNLFKQQAAGDAGRAAASWIKSLFGFHSGGVVGGGDGFSTTRVSPLAFLGAPRFHSGGIAGMDMGLRSNEVPAILEKGERVLTKEQQRGLGAQINVGVTVNGASGEDSLLKRAGAELGQFVETAVGAWVAREKRPGGVLWEPN